MQGVCTTSSVCLMICCGMVLQGPNPLAMKKKIKKPGQQQQPARSKAEPQAAKDMQGGEGEGEGKKRKRKRGKKGAGGDESS